MRSTEIKLKTIGIIHTPYQEGRGKMPIQGTFEKEVLGRIELWPEYQAGLKDLDGFSHLVLIYYFHRCKEEKLVAKPFLEDVEHGVFAIRSPYRPNHIGLSVVKLEKVTENVVTFSEVDMLDGTPLLDIKPYVAHFDSRESVKSGWIAKHFDAAGIPPRAFH